jgi:hypothetical protein
MMMVFQNFGSINNDINSRKGKHARLAFRVRTVFTNITLPLKAFKNTPLPINDLRALITELKTQPSVNCKTIIA